MLSLVLTVVIAAAEAVLLALLVEPAHAKEHALAVTPVLVVAGAVHMDAQAAVLAVHMIVSMAVMVVVLAVLIVVLDAILVLAVALVAQTLVPVVIPVLVVVLVAQTLALDAILVLAVVLHVKTTVALVPALVLEDATMVVVQHQHSNYMII